MAETLHGNASERLGRLERLRKVASFRDNKTVVVAQPMNAPAACARNPACPFEDKIRLAAKAVGVTYNARYFCVRLVGPKMQACDGFCACAFFRNRLRKNAGKIEKLAPGSGALHKRAVKAYTEENVRSMYADKLSTHAWLYALADELDQANPLVGGENVCCPHFFYNVSGPSK